MNDTPPRRRRPRGSGAYPTRSLRLGPEGAEAEQLAAQLGRILGRDMTLADYVRTAIARENGRVREIVEAEEVEVRGAIIVTREGTDIGGGRVLRGPGVWRIAGTTELIRHEHDYNLLRDIAAAEED